MTELQSLWTAFASHVVEVLPTSPFKPIIDSWSVNVPLGIQWLNWLVPVSSILTVFTAWLNAYVIYLIASVVLRWLKAIK